MATNIQGLDAIIDELLADNANEDITPLDLRTVLKQFSSSCAVNQDTASINGAWTFLVPVSGITPTSSSHLATKDYVDNNSGASSGDVVGPGSAVDNGLVRFDLTTGKLIQGGSGVKVSDVGNFTGVGNISFLTGLSTVGGIQNQNLVDKSSNETIASGAVWTFTDSPIVPTPTTDFQASTKKYVDDNIGGTISASGTPVDNQLGVWTDASTLEGDSNLTWDGSTFAVGGASTATTYNGVALTTGGSSANVLAENGSYVALAGGGDVVKVGTPVDNQIGVWTGDGTIEGGTGLTYDGTTLALAGAQTISTTLDVTGALTALSGSFENSDAGTNTVLTALTVDRQTSGTPAVGIGVGVDFNVETSVANVETLGVVDVTATDVTGAAEDGKFSFKLMTAGIAATEKMSIDVAGNVAATTFNSVPLTAAGAASNFLTEAGTYVSIGSLGGGDVNKVGTPTNNQLGIWTGDGTIEGDTNLQWDGSTLQVLGSQTVSGDLGVSGELTVLGNTVVDMSYTWRQVGNDLNISNVASSAIASLTSTRIAFIDEANEDLRTYDFDGTDWSQVGNDLNISGIGLCSMTSLTSTRIAFIDETNQYLRTYDFDGTDWSQVGNDLHISSTGSPSITALTSSRVAYISEDGSKDLRTYDFDGTDWSQVGNDLAISSVTNPEIASLTSTRIAFVDAGNEDLRTYDFDGTDWSQVGNDLNISGLGTCAIASLTSTRIAFVDNTNNSLSVYDFDGSDWSLNASYSSLTISSITNVSIASLSSNEIVFIDSTNDDLRTYSFNPDGFLPIYTGVNTIGRTADITLTSTTQSTSTTTGSIQTYGGLGVVKDAFFGGVVSIATKLIAPSNTDSNSFYETGSFTPVVSDASGAGNDATFGSLSAEYTRVGNRVTLYISAINIDTTGMTGGNNIYIKNLPFSASGSSVGSLRADSFTFTDTMLFPFIGSDTDYILIIGNSTATSRTIYTVAGISSGSTDFFIELTYNT